MATKIQIRRGTAASWTSTNPTLSSGELGLETDTNKVKIGDGATAWNSLNYFYDQSALSQANASATYLSIINASATYIPLTSQQTIINTASAAAVAYADALTTSDIAEGTNLYFTDQRAINAGSATYLPISNGTAANLTVSGIFTVSGSATYIDATNLNVTDSIINLSTEQQQEDALDQGFTASYGQSGDTEQTHKHRGLVFDKSDSKWKLFSNVAASAISTTIDFTGANQDTIVVGTLEGNVTGTSSSANYVPHTGVVGLSSNYLTQSSASSTYAPIASPTFTGTVTIPTLDLTNALPIADGGTGQTTASAALNELLPTQTGNSGRYLTTDGTSSSWGTVPAGPEGPAGPAGPTGATGPAGPTGATGDFSALYSTNAQTGTTYTLVISDVGKIIEISNTNAITLTVPTDASVPFAIGTSINLIQTNTGQLSIVGDTGVTVNGTPGTKLRAQWSSAQLIKRGTNLWMIAGDLSA